MSQEKAYEKLKLLGAGSFGEAWLARSGGDRFFVIKEMKLLPNLSKEERDRINNEVKIIRSCSHINIIKYKDFFITQENDHVAAISIVMEYAECGDLHQKIQRQREVERCYFPESQVRNWFVQICFALQYLHKKNILHRDLKTQNIFIASNEILKLGDFGISKTLANENDFTTTGVGTPQYLSPEICRQHPYDYKSDVWSLGCILYEMCALAPAFPDGDLETVVMNITRGRYRPIPKGFSDSIGSLVKIMLRNDPSKRPTVSQIVAAAVLQPDVLKYMNFITRMTTEKCTLGSSNGSDIKVDSSSSMSSSSSMEGQHSSVSI